MNAHASRPDAGEADAGDADAGGGRAAPAFSAEHSERSRKDFPALGFARRARAPTVSITLDAHTAAEAATALGAAGVCVWDGDFYAARAVGLLGLAERGGLLRTGISMYSTQSDVHRLLEGIANLG